MTTIFGETVVYTCTVTLAAAKGQHTPSTTEFHDDLNHALREFFNGPMTPFYVSSVSVIEKKKWKPAK